MSGALCHGQYHGGHTGSVSVEGMNEPALVAITKETVYSAATGCTVVLKAPAYTVSLTTGGRPLYTVTLTTGGRPLGASFCRKEQKLKEAKQSPVTREEPVTASH